MATQLLKWCAQELELKLPALELFLVLIIVLYTAQFITEFYVAEGLRGSFLFSFLDRSI